MDNKKNIEIIDISKKSRIISILAFFAPLILGFLFVDGTKENAIIFMILAILSFWLSSYIFEKGKVILRVGSIIDKDKRFYLTDHGKKIDTLRIKTEENVSDNEVLKRLEDFLIKNNVKQYSKLYVVGSDSKEDISVLDNILLKYT